jgi:UDPglucose 6-dehydrogenase
LLKDVQFCPDPYDAADGANALVIVTEWDEFRALDLKRMADLLADPLLVDLRNIYSVEDAQSAGLAYVGIGRGQAGA